MISRFLTLVFLATFPALAGTTTFQISSKEFGKPEYWAQVQEALQRQPVEVILSDELHLINDTVRIEKIGHPENSLTISGPARIEEAPDEKEERNGLVSLDECQNITIRNLHFSGTAPSGYALAVRNSQNITVEKSSFKDMTGIYFAGISVIGEATNNVTVRDCVFERVGSGGHAHMIYTAYGPQRVRVLNCQFTDCAGDFVRFRDRSDHGVVYGCTFKSTGTYKETNPPMISIPLFNDDDPEEKKPKARYEYFGTNFLFARNSFSYAKQGRQDTRFAILFHQSGFNPPGKTPLLTAEAAENVSTGTTAERLKTLEHHTGIRVGNLIILDNQYENVECELGYRAKPAYGAKSSGWEGVIDLSDLVSKEHALPSPEAAATFFEKP